MPSKNTKTSSTNYYPQFPKDVHPSVQSESRLVRDALYKLRGQSPQVIQITLTNNANLDADLTANSPLIMILSQDTVGGWTPTFSKNSDSSLKFLGTGAITWVTTANTYTSLLFWSTDIDTTYLISYLSGGNLS